MNLKAISGGCLCGALRYEASGEPFNVTHCHCVDCRRGSGAPFVTWASFRRAEFQFTTGEPATLDWSGRRRLFCAHCGTPLAFAAGPETDEVDVTVCSFDHPEIHQPADHTWAEDQLPWVQLADDLPIYDQKRRKDGWTFVRRSCQPRRRFVRSTATGLFARWCACRRVRVADPAFNVRTYARPRAAGIRSSGGRGAFSRTRDLGVHERGSVPPGRPPRCHAGGAGPARRGQRGPDARAPRRRAAAVRGQAVQLRGRDPSRHGARHHAQEFFAQLPRVLRETAIHRRAPGGGSGGGVPRTDGAIRQRPDF